jgi:hypothetical protein
MEILREAIRSFTIQPPVTHRNLTVFPLLGKPPGNRWYRTLEEALKAGTSRVTEVSQSGSVPELMFVNEGKDPVLLVDGEELKGAKQNRVLNLTLLVAGGKSLLIPVSCVEAGRWAGRSLAFEQSSYVLFARARAGKVAQVSASLSSRGDYSSDQRRLWDEIHAKQDILGTRSPTRAMEDCYRQRSGDIEDYVGAIRPQEAQAGAVFALDGRVVGAELFDHPETLAALMAKLVRSYALDAIETAGAPSAVPPPEAARAFLDQVADARMEAFPALGMGEDVRISGTRLVGAALVEDGRLVHLSAFRLAEGQSHGAGDEKEPRMASYRTRERWSRNRRGSGNTEAA